MDLNVFLGWVVERSGLDLSPRTGFGISSVEPSASIVN
jgi:hypothetical protein